MVINWYGAYFFLFFFCTVEYAECVNKCSVGEEVTGGEKRMKRGWVRIHICEHTHNEHTYG